MKILAKRLRVVGILNGSNKGESIPEMNDKWERIVTGIQWEQPVWRRDIEQELSQGGFLRLAAKQLNRKNTEEVHQTLSRPACTFCQDLSLPKASQVIFRIAGDSVPKGQPGKDSQCMCSEKWKQIENTTQSHLVLSPREQNGKLWASLISGLIKLSSYPLRLITMIHCAQDFTSVISFYPHSDHLRELLFLFSPLSRSTCQILYLNI